MTGPKIPGTRWHYQEQEVRVLVKGDLHGLRGPCLIVLLLIPQASIAGVYSCSGERLTSNHCWTQQHLASHAPSVGTDQGELA